MKKILAFLRKCKKGFTLMECVCAIAVVGLLTSIILPLTAMAMKSMTTANSLRVAAANAAAANATTATDTSKKALTQDQKNNLNDRPTGYDTYKTLYVTINYSTITGMHAESAFVFTENCSRDKSQAVSVTYYDLKYGKEEKDA